jgi:hypothetical protein
MDPTTLYDIDRYTDEQLYNILNLSAPTDNELEAKILQMIRKYSNIQNDSGVRLARFFNQVYDRFFDTDETITEGFTYAPTDPKQQWIDLSSESKRNPSDARKIMENGKINYQSYSKSDTEQLSNIIQTQSQEYSTDRSGLNPLIKQTIRRIVNIDSQFRNKAYYPLSSDFTFNLSEPLKDVLSLKLYSVQIPYTWYTINNNYGSNFLYLKGVTAGIDNGSHDYKIQIGVGNYSSSDFVVNINNSINQLKTDNLDVSFGSTAFSYNSVNSKSTFTVDIQNIYNEPYYQIVMDATLSAYLQYQNTQYPLNTIYSTNTPQPNSPDYPLKGFAIDNSINFFTVIHYVDPSNQYNNSTSIIKDVFKVRLLSSQQIGGAISYSPYVGTVYPGDNLLPYITNGIQTQPLLDPSHSYINYTRDSISNQYKYILSLQLNKSVATLYPNSKLCIQFPSKNQYKDASNNPPFWSNEYVTFQKTLNSWTRRDISNINVPPYNLYPTMKWKSVAMSDNGTYQTAAVSINTRFDGTNSNLYYSSDGGTTWFAAKDINQIPLPTYYIWDRVVITGTGEFQIAYSSNNSKLWFSTNYGKLWKDSGLDYQWVCLDYGKSANTTGFVIVAATKNPNKIYNLNYDGTTWNMTEISQLTDPINGLKTHREYQSTNNSFNNISVSQYGKYQIALTYDTIYYSGDTGINWNYSPLIYNGTAVTNLCNARISYNSDTTNIIYITITTQNQCYLLDPSNNKAWLSDPTRTWKQCGQLFNYIQSISISSDSNVMVICDNTYLGTQGNIYTSYDYGNTWSTKVVNPQGTNAPNIQWEEVAISKLNNGLYQTAVGINDPSGGIWAMYYNQDINLNIPIYTSIQSFVGFEQTEINTAITYTSKDPSNNSVSIFQYFFYNMNNLYSENYYSYNYANFTVSNTNNTIKFIAENGHGPIDQYAAQTITITIPPGIYTLNNDVSRNDLLYNINTLFANTPQLIGSCIKKIPSNSNGYEYLKFVFNINKIYTTNDYKLVFYDVYSFVSCFFGAQGVQNITWNNTLGWILGYRDFTEYYLTAANVQTSTTNGSSYYNGSPTSVYTYTSVIDSNTKQEVKSIATLTGDTSVNTTLYNYFYIILNDYNQNHLNDGVVINIQSENNLPLPSYTGTAIETCNPDGTATYTSGSLSRSQIYSANIIKQTNAPDITSQASIKQHATYPSVQDIFAFIPVKVNGQITGTTYIEFGGSLQNQTRLYFGPVNIHRMSVKLVTDKGDILNLNNADWSFSFECEHQYRNS